MPNLRCRGSIAPAAVVVALLWSRPAAAQVGPHHGHGGLINNLATGASFEIMDRSMAEHRLRHLEAKLRRNAARGDMAAVGRDARRIDNVRFRIGVDDWLIRYNLCQQYGPYPDPIRLDPLTCEAIGQYRRPSFAP